MSGIFINYRRRIFDAIDSSNVVLVLIGPRWSTRRLEEPDDLLRQEIARALTSGVPVVPVLVNNAHMPAWLPPGIQQLRHLQAAPLRNSDWRNDVAGLVGRLQHLVPVAQPVPGGDASTTALGRWPVRIVAVLAFILSGARTVLGG